MWIKRQRVLGINQLLVTMMLADIVMHSAYIYEILQVLTLDLKYIQMGRKYRSFNPGTISYGKWNHIVVVLNVRMSPCISMES